ncbi:MAG: PilT/PilU family type 4a pilus ATPase [Patescibacteria group bacterium]|nr:PilT/PilU family type 4a pilus ATPase [Patescibacteria group bacterium]
MIHYQFLDVLIQKNGSDLHIIPNYPPAIRVNGELHQLVNQQLITPEISRKITTEILKDHEQEIFFSNKEIDLAISYRDFRFRVNFYFARGNVCANFRLVPPLIKEIDDLNLPPILKKVVNLKQGLVLITGPTGEGKSTTLAAIINEINKKYTKHIITIEDPIEYLYPPQKSIISQRELNNDTFSWTRALRSALREDPDVIMVGEMRDYDTISLVITAAETGHLVFSTLHTNSATETIDRIIDIFPATQQNQIRHQLASVLNMVISQRLVPRIDKQERTPAVEVLINNPAISNLIRDQRTKLIDNILITSEEEGQILLEKNLVYLYQKGIINKETAFSFAIRPRELEKFLKSIS